MAPIRAVVLDSWPLIESYAGNEPAKSTLNQLLDGPGARPTISAVTFTEVCYIFARDYGQPAAAARADYLHDLLNIEPLDPATAEAAAWVKHVYDISLGDSFAAATALKHGAALWTGDPELLCPDRVWGVLDLRAPAARNVCPPRRRAAAAHLSDQQLVSLIAGPLHAAEPIAAPQQPEAPAVEGPVLGFD